MLLKKITLLSLSLILFTSCSIFKQTNNPYKPELIQIQGGEFIFGDFYEGKNTDALPLHKVRIKNFKLSKYEITYAQYDYYSTLKNKPLIDSELLERGSRAAAYVTWDQAVEFCEFHGMRLPSEVEWEYAARSGGKNELYAGTSNPDSLKYYGITTLDDIHASSEIGLKKPNGVGLYDMTGNVFEWVGEFYQFYTMPEQLHDNEQDAVRAFRGGSFTEKKFTNRTYWRLGTLRSVAAEDIGFRCAE